MKEEEKISIEEEEKISIEEEEIIKRNNILKYIQHFNEILESAEIKQIPIIERLIDGEFGEVDNTTIMVVGMLEQKISYEEISKLTGKTYEEIKKIGVDFCPLIVDDDARARILFVDEETINYLEKSGKIKIRK